MPHGNKDGYISRKRRAEHRNQPMTTARQREAVRSDIKTAAIAAKQERTLTPLVERPAPFTAPRSIKAAPKSRRF